MSQNIRELEQLIECITWDLDSHSSLLRFDRDGTTWANGFAVKFWSGMSAPDLRNPIIFWVLWKSSGRFWGAKAVKTPVDMGFYVLGAALKFGIMSDVGIRQETASSVGRVFVRGLSGLRERSWRIR